MIFKEVFKIDFEVFTAFVNWLVATSVKDRDGNGVQRDQSTPFKREAGFLSTSLLFSSFLSISPKLFAITYIARLDRRKYISHNTWGDVPSPSPLFHRELPFVNTHDGDMGMSANRAVIEAD